jgi:SAM-dependent methyltransferase
MRSLKEFIRHWARENLLTYNTIRYRVEFPRILEAFKLVGHAPYVVDGGAGGGQMLRKVFEAGYCERGLGLEPDPRLFAIMQENFASTPALTCVEAGLLEIPLESATVDCAMTTQVLEHIVEHEQAAAELGRIVKSGGHILVSVPHPPEPFHTPGHIREGYTEADLQQLFPPERYELRYSGYSMTRPTMDAVVRLAKLPFFVPISWADKETRLTDAERRAALPYGITCLFRKLT